MRSRNTRQIFVLLTVLLAVILGGSAALAQGNGRGGDRKGGDNKRGGQSPQPQRQDRQPKAEKAQREQRRTQQRDERPQYQREQPRRQKAELRDNGRNEQRRPNVRQAPEERVFAQRQNRNERWVRSGESRRQRRGDDHRANRQPQARSNNAWPNNYGYERSRIAHERNDARKAWKNEQKTLRRYNRGYRSYTTVYQTGPYYRADEYNNDRSGYRYPEYRRVSFLRNLIASVVSSNAGYNDNYYSRYQPAFYPDTYYNANYNNYGGNYYTGYSPYQTFAAAPYYADHQPYGYSYQPQYGYDPYYADNHADNESLGYYSNSGSGVGIMQQLFTRLLTLGYDEGYRAGLAARNAGYDDRYYSNPYDYEEANYIPYSNSLGENRRCLSDGYGLGYDDALYNQPGSVRYEDGNVDLLSVLLGLALQTS